MNLPRWQKIGFNVSVCITSPSSLFKTKGIPTNYVVNDANVAEPCSSASSTRTLMESQLLEGRTQLARYLTFKSGTNDTRKTAAEGSRRGAAKFLRHAAAAPVSPMKFIREYESEVWEANLTEIPLHPDFSKLILYYETRINNFFRGGCRRYFFYGRAIYPAANKHTGYRALLAQI